jgi:transposase
MPGKRATEPFRRQVAHLHRDGINRSCLSRRERIGSATVERWYHDGLGRSLSEFKNAPCPKTLGIDEHFFSRRDGYAITLCDLGKSRIYDVVRGRSEASLEGYLNRLTGKDNVEVVCMDLSPTYRALARKHFPQARIVADRFHVIRLVNHHFLACWKQIDPLGAKNRGLISLMRRHREHLKSPEQAERLDAYLARFPGLARIYEFKQRLCRLLLVKHRTATQCRPLAAQLLRAIQELKASKLPPLVTLAQTLHEWAEEIATMWRFTKNNGITEGFHNKMENLKRQAYGFRNFENYRLRVRVLCS